MCGRRKNEWSSSGSKGLGIGSGCTVLRDGVVFADSEVELEMIMMALPGPLS